MFGVLSVLARTYLTFFTSTDRQKGTKSMTQEKHTKGILDFRIDLIHTLWHRKLRKETLRVMGSCSTPYKE
jgi:hypothetical protein